jgi:GntR family transcriptional regulator of arabinose operon
VQKPEKDHRSSALYSQVLNDIRERILAGDLTAGERLPTELDIAQQHHVSRGTVRQALNILVNEGLLERIQGSGTFVRQSPLVREHTIAPAAQKSIGVILNGSGDELSMSILRGIEQATKPRGYHLSFAHAEEDMQIQAQDIARLKATTVGLIISPVSEMSYDDAIAQLKHERFPFVLVDHYLSDLDCDYVVSDNLGGGYRATEHLLILGHTRIGFAYAPGGSLHTTSVRDRWEGYRKALMEYNLPYDEALIYHKVSNKKAAENTSYDDIILSSRRPSAIFAATDVIALGLLEAAQRHALHIPEDLALVGFDDLSFAAHVSCPLTTVAQHGTEAGIRAGTLLINRIEQQISDTPKHIELPTNLIIRQSCGARLRVSSSTSEHNP